MGTASDDILQAWADAMSAQGLARGTIRQRINTARRLEDFLGHEVQTCTGPEVVAFMARPKERQRERSPELGRASKATYHRDLRAFFSWAVDNEHIVRDPMARMRQPRVPRGVPHPISTPELLRAIDAAHGDLRAWVVLAAFEGLRVHEVAKVRGDDFTDTHLRVVGKGGVDALMPLHPRVRALAADYPMTGAWFPGRCAGTVRPETVSRKVSDLLRSLGIRGTAHSLRHWFGTEVLRSSGGNLRRAQELLRHSSPATTAIYTQVSSDELTAAVLALPA